jgi:hypothetical protein
VSARDDLALDIFLADNSSIPEGELLQDWADAPDQHRPYAQNIADGLLGKGYRKPRTITERHEDNGPDALAPLSVVLSNGKPAIMQHDGTFMDYDGSSWDTWEMTYPLTVIHEPEAVVAA